MILTGKEFRKYARDRKWTLVKYFSSKDFTKPQKEHYNHKYEFRKLNIIPENEVDLLSNAGSGGFYFTYLESGCWVNYFWFSVTVPDDAMVAIFEGDMKFKTDKLFISNEIPQTEYLWISILMRNSLALEYAPFQTEKMCLSAVRRNGFAIVFAKMLTREVYKSAFRCDPKSITIIDNKTYDVLLCAVKANSLTLEYIEDQDEHLCVIAVCKLGKMLKFVKNQTRKICIAAVRNDGMALEYVLEQDYEICIEALNNNKLAAKFLKEEFKCLAR